MIGEGKRLLNPPPPDPRPVGAGETRCRLRRRLARAEPALRAGSARLERAPSAPARGSPLWGRGGKFTNEVSKRGRGKPKTNIQSLAIKSLLHKMMCLIMIDTIKIKVYSFYFAMKYNLTYRSKTIKHFFYLCATIVYSLMLVDAVKPDLLRPKSVSDYSTKGAVENEIEYFYRIGKTDTELKYIKTSDILTNAVKILPVVVAVVKKNPVLYITYGWASFLQLTTGMSLRHFVKEGRPDDQDNKTSFPSGHSLFVFTSTIVLFLCLRGKKYSIVALTCSIMVAILRVLSHRHYVIDVVCGAGIGMIAGLITFYILSLVNKKLKIGL